MSGAAELRLTNIARKRSSNGKAMLAHIAADHGYKPGWIAHKYREKFGEWPRSNSVTPIKPSPEVLSWVRSRNIAFAKRRAA